MASYHYEGYYHRECNQGELDDDGGGSSQIHANRSLAKMKSFDAVVFDLLKVTPDMFARQLTLLDFSIFCAIRPEEISTCGWTKKEKLKISPNVVAMTRRFNHTSFWVIREILNASTLKIRAERLIHFIRIAKKLSELNNLHSLMSVVQSLTSSSIHRLSQTWALVPKNHKATFDRMHSLVREDDNRSSLRAHMSTIRLPCIPFLGMYLSDVMFINSAHPDTGGLESHERANKMNNILRVVSEYQKSDYGDLVEVPHIKHYLNSVKYIEELQRFLEEDNYKLSLKIEPPPRKSGNTSTRTTSENSQGGKGKFSTSPLQDKFVPCHRKSRSLGKEFYCGHKNKNQTGGGGSNGDSSGNVKIQKRQSLGGGGKHSKAGIKAWSPASHNNKQQQQQRQQETEATSWSTDSNIPSGSLPRSALSSGGALPPPVAPLNVSLLDDSIIHHPDNAATPSNSDKHRQLMMTPSTGGGGGGTSAAAAVPPHVNNSSVGSSTSNSGSEFSEYDDSITWFAADRGSDSRTCTTMTTNSTGNHLPLPCQFEGVLRRKCVRKKGRKPSMNPWSRYWVKVRDGQLLFFSSCKSLTGGGSDRNNFKLNPSKLLPIVGWMVLTSSPHHHESSRHHKHHADSFQLSNPEDGTIYRFQCDSPDVNQVWISILKESVKGAPKPEKDLIDLGDR